MTWQSDDDILNNSKEALKTIVSTQCQNHILAGFTATIDGTLYHFSYDREAQANYSERWQLFQNSIITEIEVTAHLETATGEPTRLLVTKDTFTTIYLASVLHKEASIQKLHADIYPLIDAATTVSSLDDISYDMDIIFPTPPSLTVSGDNVLSEEVEDLKVSTAMSTAELMNLILMSSGLPDA